MSKRPGYSPEGRERAVRMVLTGEHEHQSHWVAITSFASKTGCTPEALQAWVTKSSLPRQHDSNKTSYEKPGVVQYREEALLLLGVGICCYRYTNDYPFPVITVYSNQPKRSLIRSLDASCLKKVSSPDHPDNHIVNAFRNKLRLTGPVRTGHCL